VGENVVKNHEFDNWCSNNLVPHPHHPWQKEFEKLYKLGANLDLVLLLCRGLAAHNAVSSQVSEFKKRLSDKKSRWRKGFRGLFTSHPGGKLRLTEPARIYTHYIIRFTIESLKNRGLVDSTQDLIPESEVQWIKQRAIQPLATAPNLIQADYDRAASELGNGASNLFAVAGVAMLPEPQAKEWLESLFDLHQKGSAGRDDAGTWFLLLLTEHLRQRTTKGKPHFKLAFNLMRRCQSKFSRKIDFPARSAMVRVAKLKKEYPAWQSVLEHLERQINSPLEQESVERNVN
jgi:hypothetical protein